VNSNDFEEYFPELSVCLYCVLFCSSRITRGHHLAKDGSRGLACGRPLTRENNEPSCEDQRTSHSVTACMLVSAEL